MKKTRGITIKRTVEVEVTDKNGNVKKVKQVQNFPCLVNAAIPFDHKMCK